MFIVTHLLDQSRYMSFVGIFGILLVAFIFSRHKSKINIRQIASGLLMQFVFAFCILRTAIGQRVFETIANGFNVLYAFAGEGGAFLFGRLVDPSGPWAVVFAFKLLPMIIFFGALMSVLFHFGIIQLFVKGISVVFRPILGTSGAETLCAAANSMLGATEAPLLIKHYLKKMTESEMLVVMVSGMATLAGSLLAVYGSIGVPMIHLLSASVMAIPSSIVISKILIPETKKPDTMGDSDVTFERKTTNVLDAISQGTTDGMSLAVNVAAMLISFISLIALLNSVLSSTIGFTLNDIFAKAFSYVAYALGVSWQDKEAAGLLLGQKLVINEFVAYTTYVGMELTERSRAIMTYALAGFSNFSVIGIEIGGIGALVPEKRAQLTRLGMTALLGGTLANFLNAAIAGLFI